MTCGSRSTRSSSKNWATAPDDVPGFNEALGLTPEGWVPFDDHSGAERFQILSPVRQHAHGVNDINRLLQHRFRQMQLRKAAGRGGVALGDEQIVWGDKVILLSNGTRGGYDYRAREKVKDYLANGEVGFTGKPKIGSYLDGNSWVARDGATASDPGISPPAVPRSPSPTR